MVLAYILASILIVSVIAFVGVFTLYLRPKKLEKIIFGLVSFAAGALLGAAFLDLLPEAFERTGKPVFLYTLIGIVIFYMLETFFHWYHRHHTHHHFKKHHVKPYTMLNLIGDGVHNFVDGMIIAASYLVSIPLGIVTTVAVILHEIPQELGDFGILVYGGIPRGKALFFNFLSALTAFLGALLVYFLGATEAIISFLVPFAAGGFTYIATADLLPELHRTKPDKAVLQLVFFILGIAVIWAMGVFIGH
jgi:zinc and cadmium transporter